jgi:Fuc2NAc and GlcNAc transferase
MVCLEGRRALIRYLELLCALAATVLTAWLLTGAVRRHALRNAMLDIPNSRSSHATPIARGGGLAIVLVYLAALLLLWLFGMLEAAAIAAFGGGGVLVAVVGYMDDRKALPASVRFAVHVLGAGWVVAYLGGFADAWLRSFGLHGVAVGSVLAVFSIAWMTNLFNFMDGIDGIAASEAIFVACAGAFLGWRHGAEVGVIMAMLALAGASAGFLVWNWPPARIFMGDVGSGFLGFTLAALGIAASAQGALPIEVCVILGGVFVVDATVTLLRRVLRGDRWYEAHRAHAYQRLARRWNAHLPVTAAVIAVDIIWLFPWAWAAAEHRDHAPLLTVAALAPLIVAALACGSGRHE